MRSGDDDWDDWDDEPTRNDDQVPINEKANSFQNEIYEETDQIDNEVVNNIVLQLKEYMVDVADGYVREQISKKLNTITYDRFMMYYIQNPKLGDYFIRHELSRMDFSVIYQDIETNDKHEIACIYEQLPLLDIWRLANQSIYAELLLILQSTYFKPALSISVVSSSSKIIVNIDDNILHAMSDFELYTVSDSRKTNKSREQLASISGVVKVDLKRKCLKQYIGTPILRLVFDADLRISADMILELKESNQVDNSEDIVLSLSSVREQLLETRDILVGMKIPDKIVEGMVGSVAKIVGVSKHGKLSLYRSGPNGNTDANNRVERGGVFEGFISSFGALIGANNSSSQNTGDMSLYRKTP